MTTTGPPEPLIKPMLLKLTELKTTPFVRGEPDTSAFNAGRQSIGHDIQADIMLAAPEMYWVMIEESQTK